eukprot:GHUV01017370.1.p1 GENE.GHUV01017370.1~~GHUV01017370.1.p1  ORF type:complete len:296 (+),score=74.51 GHUV01017370.1:53-889(+)
MDGQQYIVAEPIVEFELQVRIVNPLNRVYRVSVRVDGQYAGYTICTSQAYDYRAPFPGWYYNTGDGKVHYRHFKFGACRPSATATTVEHPDQIIAGKIEVKCNVVTAVGEKSVGSWHASAGPFGSLASSKKLPEGKKWFLQPGLKAETGSLSSKTHCWNTKEYRKLCELPSLKIKYDTAENLQLRRILKPSNPQHAAILQNSNNPRLAALLGGGSSRQRHGGGSSRRQVKQEHNRKGSKRGREQQPETDSSDDDDEDDQIPHSATGEVVNLCDEVGGR